jgi:hypothetical protein
MPAPAGEVRRQEDLVAPNRRDHEEHGGAAEKMDHGVNEIH